jgi:hypothetical protein
MVSKEQDGGQQVEKGASDRRQVAAGEGYEVRYFARKYGIRKDEAEQLIARIGNDREKLNAAVKLRSA